jgi:hypothetical protein
MENGLLLMRSEPEVLLAEQRARMKKAIVAPVHCLEPVAHVENRMIAGPAGDLPVRLYTPEGSGPFPVLMFFQKSLRTLVPQAHQALAEAIHALRSAFATADNQG